LANGTGGFDIHHDVELNVDETIGCVGEECWPSHRASPLRDRIGRRNKLRRDLARRSEGSVVEARQISLTVRFAVSGFKPQNQRYAKLT
jgi:hypothetical protein